MTAAAAILIVALVAEDPAVLRVAPYAVHAAYGGPAAVARLIDAAHGAGLSAFLDVVYNHLGPEGNYLSE